MAREFSKPFYRSKEWKDVRELAMLRDKGLCQHCYNPAEEVHHIIHLNPENISDPGISLNLDNLICLCRECHFKEHKIDASRGRRKKNQSESTVLPKVIFDSSGNIVPPIK